MSKNLSIEIYAAIFGLCLLAMIGSGAMYFSGWARQSDRTIETAADYAAGFAIFASAQFVVHAVSNCLLLRRMQDAIAVIGFALVIPAFFIGGKKSESAEIGK